MVCQIIHGKSLKLILDPPIQWYALLHSALFLLESMYASITSFYLSGRTRHLGAFKESITSLYKCPGELHLWFA